jgi:hypothetical protein
MTVNPFGEFRIVCGKPSNWATGVSANAAESMAAPLAMSTFLPFLSEWPIFVPASNSAMRSRATSAMMDNSSSRSSFEHGDLLVFDQPCALVLVDAAPGEHFGVDDDALDTRRHTQGGVFDVAGLLAEDGPQQFFFRRQLGFTLGVILPTRMSPGPTSAPRRMMPLSSRFFRASSPTLGMSRVMSSLPSLVSRATTSNSSMCTEV